MGALSGSFGRFFDVYRRGFCGGFGLSSLQPLSSEVAANSARTTGRDPKAARRRALLSMEYL